MSLSSGDIERDDIQRVEERSQPPDLLNLLDSLPDFLLKPVKVDIEHMPVPPNEVSADTLRGGLLTDW